jgi:acyl-CoA reductase-like NAD-dependent aldehyde dehydrogenase
MLKHFFNTSKQKLSANIVMSLEKITTISPITNKPILTRNGLSDADIQSIPETATRAFESFRRTSLSERQQIVKKALKLLDERQDALGKELTEQMGRPITYTPKEVTTAVMRGEYLLKISDETLKDTAGEPEKGFKRYVRKVPLGPVLILFPWNVSRTRPLVRTFANIEKVSLSDSYQLSCACHSVWKLRHTETVPTNANQRRADPENLLRGWST